jgi:mannosyltransferase
VAIICSLTQLADKSLWFDEALSAAAARLPFRDLTRFLSEQAAPVGLYYGLLHGWVSLGTSEVALRLFSVLWAVGAVAFLVALGTRLFDRRVGMIAGLVLAANAFFVSYAQEARAYTLAVFLCLAATLAFVRALDGESPRRWAVYGVVAAVAIYAHYFTGLVLLAHGVSVLLLPRDRRPWRGLVLAGGTGAVLVTPLLIKSVGQPSLVDWVHPPTPSAVWEFIWLIGGMSVVGVSLYAAAGIWGGLATRRNRSAHPEWLWGLWLAAAWAFMPPVVALAVSKAFRPVFVPRYLIVALPGVALLVGLGLARFRGWLTVVALAVLLAVSGAGLLNWYRTPPRQDWRSVMTYVTAHDRIGDGLVPVGNAHAGFGTGLGSVSLRYYAGRMAAAFQARGGDLQRLLQNEPVPGDRRRIWLISLRNVIDPSEDAVELAQISDALALQGFHQDRLVSFVGSYAVMDLALYVR